jgi:hypothetical protein
MTNAQGMTLPNFNKPLDSRLRGNDGVDGAVHIV